MKSNSAKSKKFRAKMDEKKAKQTEKHKAKLEAKIDPFNKKDTVRPIFISVFIYACLLVDIFLDV